MTQKFISRKSSPSPTTSPPVQTSRFASRPFAEPVQQKAQQPNLQTILQRAERTGNPTAKMAWGNTQPEVQRQGVTENEIEESKVQKEAATDTQSQDLEEQKDTEVQTKLDSTIQQQESDQKPEEETVQKQSTPEEEQNHTEVQTKLDSTIQQQESEQKPEEETIQQQSTPEEEQKDSEVQTQLDTTIQQQESEKKPEEETVQKQSTPEEEQKDTEVQTQLDSTIQSQESEQKPEEETVQKQSSPEEEQKNSEVQTKLTVGQPGDKYEQEADNVAARVMTMPETETEENTPQSQDVEKEESTVQKQPIAPSITSVQRRLESSVNLKSVRDNKAGKKQVAPSLENRLASEKGGGSLLPEDTRSFMESRFGADFSEVRVHTDSQAAQMNQELGAQAFTHGNDIYFNSGKYDPSSGKGQELLAHELTHTIQQTGGKTAKSNNNSNNKKSSKANKVQMKSMTPLAEPTIQRREETSSEAVQTVPTPSTVEGGTSDLPEATGGETAPSEQTPGSSGSAPPSEGGGASSSGGGSSEQPETTGGETALSAQTPGSSGSTPPSEGGGASSPGGGSSAPNSPEGDPQFQAVVDQSQGVAKEQQQHEPPQQKSQEAQDAAEPPSNEVESKAQDKQVDEMGNAPTPPFDAKAFKEALMNRIAEITPKTLEEADQFKDNNQLESVKNDVTGKVDEAQQDSQGELEEKTKETPDTSGITPKPVTPLPPNEVGETPSINEAEKAAPKSKGESEVEAPAQARSQELDQKMAEANITEEQLAKSNEPQFQSALDSKKAAQTHSETAPKAYRQAEQTQLSQAQSTAVATVQEKVQGMHDQRSQSLEQVTGKQVEGKGKDEESRAKIAGDIDKIYQTTKTKVDEKLAKLTTDVESAFDAGAEEAKKVFEDYVGKRMDAYKAERYSGFWGPGKWLKDKVFGMPDEVNKFYEEGRDLYLKHMDGVIDKVVTIVGKGLTEAKNDVADGRKQVKEYVAQLPEDLKAIGGEIATNVQSQFDGLEQDIQSKQDELIDTLAQKYKENLDAVDARIKEMQEENKGLIQKAVEFVVGVIKTIAEMMQLLLQVLARVASVVPQILADPIGFFSNLVSGLKQGFQNFIANISKHLQQGLMSWLTGAVAGTGIQMPESFDLQGVFSIAAQILGLGYPMIRSRAVKRLGEEKVSFLEQSFETFRLLATQGVSALWESVKDKVGDLKSMVMDTIQNYLIEKVITEGIQYILSMLNPASAFVKACQAIYRIVKFFMERAAQIAELINAILDSIVAIAAGNVGQMVKAIENALAKAVPVVISFLARLLGLGDISRKVQEMFEKARQPIEKAIDKVLDEAVKFAKKMGNKDKKKGKGNDKSQQNTAKDKRTKDEKAKDLAAAQKKLQGIIAKSESTKQVQQQFPAIKKEFGLKKLEWDKLGTPSASIIMELNPTATIDLTQFGLLLNEGDTSHSNGNGFEQKVIFTAGEINSHPVGKVMEAQQLGPNHPQGGPPSGSNLKEIMKDLDTDPKLSNENKYIKGHLLNDNLGGPGDDNNLYPITAAANKMHENKVESTVKKWVNNEGYWVYYKVKVDQKNVKIVNKEIKEINADFICEANRLDADGKRAKLGALNTTIHSEFKAVKQSSVGNASFDPSAKAPHKDPKFDENKVELSSSRTETQIQELDGEIAKMVKKHQEQLEAIQMPSKRPRREGANYADAHSVYRSNLRSESDFINNLLTIPDYSFEDYYQSVYKTIELKQAKSVWNGQITKINGQEKRSIINELEKALNLTISSSSNKRKRQDAHQGEPMEVDDSNEPNSSSRKKRQRQDAHQGGAVNLSDGEPMEVD
ncbi:MAG: DUF4157 domain-containing protein [Lyngbya sp.]|nr:DUF4157 domain-containing protein [Lyngbya sp.]